jgi:tRNA(Phe) wybutosine-synthesizing methylase Tyw3
MRVLTMCACAPVRPPSCALRTSSLRLSSVFRMQIQQQQQLQLQLQQQQQQQQVTAQAQSFAVASESHLLTKAREGLHKLQADLEVERQRRLATERSVDRARLVCSGSLRCKLNGLRMY